MKKLNNKGFMLVEILVASVAIMVIFTAIFINFYPTVGEYEQRIVYNDINAKYASFYVRKLYSDETFNLTSSSPYVSIIENGTCKTITGVNTSECTKLVTSLGIKDVVVTGYNTDVIKEFIKADDYSGNLLPLKQYINILPSYETLERDPLRLIVYTNDGFATSALRLSLDKSGANAPELKKGMVPVYYDNSNDTWRVADKNNYDLNNKWYDYTTTGKRWANMVLVKENGIKTRNFYTDQANVGQIINTSDILAMYVWIPRFSAIKPTTPANLNNPPSINVTFVDTNTAAHDAFTFDGNISGFWYGKFETSSDTTCTPANNSALESGCNLTTIMPRIKPNVENWIGAQVATYFTAYRNMETTGNEYGLVGNEVDTHMSKNNEWGAVAYLTHSIYGRCSNATTCTEIGINNDVDNITFQSTTGYGAPAGTVIDTNNGTYETALGMNASTTGNIYGIYDMSGGAWEYVMGNYNRVVGDNNTDNATSGFIGTNNDGTQTTGFPFPTSKYINIYTTTSAYTQSGYQHTLVETAGWTSDYNGFVSGNLPWFVCGGRYYDNKYAGIFAHSNAYGNGSLYNSSRAVITP